MGWTSPDSWPTRLVSGDPLIILLAFIVTLTLPVLLHLYFYTTSARAALTPKFLLLGPAGAGKTSLVSLLSHRSVDRDAAETSPTRTSQAPSTISLALPASIPLGSNKYRSTHDSSLDEASGTTVPYQMIDTPGHGKLRLEQALSHLQDPAVRGVIFVADSTALDSSDSEATRDTAAYLHDALLALQRRKTGNGTAKAKTEIALLIAANKQDLFTALPAGAVRDRLQAEIERVRVSRSRGISSVDKADDVDEDDILGGGGEAKFSFKLLQEEYGIAVDVLGGAVRGEEAGKGVRRWEEWIGSRL